VTWIPEVFSFGRSQQLRLELDEEDPLGLEIAGVHVVVGELRKRSPLSSVRPPSPLGGEPGARPHRCKLLFRSEPSVQHALLGARRTGGELRVRGARPSLAISCFDGAVLETGVGPRGKAGHPSRGDHSDCRRGKPSGSHRRREPAEGGTRSCHGPPAR